LINDILCNWSNKNGIIMTIGNIKQTLNRERNHLNSTRQFLIKEIASSESLFSRKILAILSPKLVRITRLKVGPDSSCVRHALAHSRLRAVASTMTLRRDAFPASPVNARLSWALRLALLLQCSPVSS
jgi:hypothetical protein